MSNDNKKNWNKFKEEHEAEDEILEEGAEEPVFNELIEDKDEDMQDKPSYRDLEEQLILSEKKANEQWEKSVRATAELENVRRRMEREVTNAHKYGTEKLITALLPVADSIEQALQIADKNSDTAMYEGLELTMKLFNDVLQKFEVECIDPANAPFDPQEHEAMSIQEIPGTPDNTVIAVFQKGYKLNGRVIRPARVIVSKNKP